MGYCRLAVLAAIAVVAPAVAGQEPDRPQPTFRSETNYVQLPVRVLDARGRFVSGLTQSDFQVLEDGKPQSITAFSAFDIPFVPADSTVPDAPVAALDVVVSNDMPLVDGRVYLFVLDDFNTERGDTLKVRQLMHDFISQRLSANDLAAISMLGGARSQHFTRNRKLLHDAVDRFFGDLDPALPSRGHQALNSVARMAEWLGSIRGRRKALVLVTPSAICVIGADDCRESLQQALRTAVQSDVTVYTVDPRGLDTSRQSRAENNNPNATRGDPYQEATNGQAATGPFAEGRAEGRGAADGARYLAEESGGIAVVGTTAIERGLDRIVADSSAYYLLGYRSTNTRADGRFRRNQVKIARGDLRIVHRNGYFALRQEDIDDRPVRASVMAEMQDLARSPLPVSAMPLRASAASFLSGDGKARVAVIVEMPPEALRPMISEGRYRLNIGLSIAFYDRDGTSVGRDDPNIELDIPESAAPKVTPNGMRVVSRVEVPPGEYRLWVGGVQMSSGLRGSVMTEIAVPDFDRDPIALSSLAVSSTNARRIYTPQTDGLLDDVLGGPPVAHRIFPLDNELWLYGEIYDNRPDGGEVTGEVTVASSQGTTVYRTELEPAPVQFGQLARIPLNELGRGDFTATVTVTSKTPKPITATRAIAFQVQ
jgi:VWFA-related protein